MARPLEDVAQCPIAPRRVTIVDYTVLAGAVAGDAQEPTRECGERLAQRFGGGGHRVVAVAAPVPLRCHINSCRGPRRTISRTADPP